MEKIERDIAIAFETEKYFYTVCAKLIPLGKDAVSAARREHHKNNMKFVEAAFGKSEEYGYKMQDLGIAHACAWNRALFEFCKATPPEIGII